MALFALVFSLISPAFAHAEPEPNDTPATATPLLVGRTTSSPGDVAKAADLDYYSFTVAISGTFVAEVSNVTAVTGGVVLAVTDSAGTALGTDITSRGTGNTDARVVFAAASAGTYRASVRPIDTTAASVGATYTIRVLPSWDHGLTWDASDEPNDVLPLASPLALGRAGRVETFEARNPAFATNFQDVDWAHITIATPGTYVAEAFNVAAGTGGISLGVNSPTGLALGSDITSNGTGNTDARVVFTAATAGDYFISATPINNVGGTYSLRVLPSWDHGLTWDTRAEPNDVVSLAFPVRLGVAQGQTVTARSPGFATNFPDVDWFRIPVSAGQQITAVINQVSGSATPAVLLLDGAGVSVASVIGCNQVAPSCVNLPFTATTTGNYFLRVTPLSATAAGDYTLCVRTTATTSCRANTSLNPGFELDANADGRPDAWTSDTRFTRSNAIAPHTGSFSGRLTAANNSAVTLTQVQANQPRINSYRLSSWVNIPATTDTFSFQVRVRWRDAGNAVLRTDIVGTRTASTTGWVTVAATLAPPPGTNNVAIDLVATSLNATIYIDDVTWTATT